MYGGCAWEVSGPRVFYSRLVSGVEWGEWSTVGTGAAVILALQTSS